jgi:serine/threonine protein kinase
MHRDVKPANMVLSPDLRTLKLIDFGLSKSFPRPVNVAGAARSRSRRHSSNVGTPRYTAPEVLECSMPGEHTGDIAAYTEKADIFSAALVIWYLLAGRRPNGRLPQWPKARPSAERARRRWPEMAAVVERMWAHDAHERPSAEECVGELEALHVRAGLACGCSQQ